jgi:8-oxo-dGTP diphosphatase
MRSDQADWAERFHELFAPGYVDYADVETEFRVGVPPDELVARMHVLGLDEAGRVIVCRSVEGWRFLPGGTREPGEALPGLVRRELLEEAGCALLGEPEPAFAYLHARSRRTQPFRPHLPHPEAAWAYAVARVTRVGEPANPPDGETVVEVVALPPEDAATWLAVWDDVEHAQVVRLAMAMGLLS